MSQKFDAIVIGAGQAGPPLAGRLTAAGQTVAVIERKLFGGTCVNTGCMPTKTLVASAQAAHVVRRAADFGVTIPGPAAIDMPRVKARADAVSQRARKGVEDSLVGMPGCSVVRGHARFAGPNEIHVGSQALTAERIFIDVGARAIVPPIPGLDQVDYLTNASILALDCAPAHLAILGGSYIGLEFAQMYRRFGAEVTVIEKGPRLIPREDADISAAVKEILEKEGIVIRLGAECARFAREAGGVRLNVTGDGRGDLVASHALIAIGRRPNTDDLGLDKAGVKTDPRGFILVDEELRASAAGVWALGECNGRGAFTHTSYNDFEIVAANLLDGGARRVSDRVPVYALYIDPPLGRAGLGEEQARALGRPILVGRRDMTQVGRAVEKDETQGFMKIVVDAESKAILGAAILGPGGDEAVHSVIDMMVAKASALTLRDAMHIHPTVAELIPTIAGELKPAS